MVPFSVKWLSTLRVRGGNLWIHLSRNDVLAEFFIPSGHLFPPYRQHLKGLLCNNNNNNSIKCCGFPCSREIFTSNFEFDVLFELLLLMHLSFCSYSHTFLNDLQWVWWYILHQCVKFITACLLHGISCVGAVLLFSVSFACARSTLRTTGGQASICCSAFTVVVRRAKVSTAFSTTIARLSVVCVITPSRYGRQLSRNHNNSGNDISDRQARREGKCGKVFSELRNVWGPHHCSEI